MCLFSLVVVRSRRSRSCDFVLLALVSSSCLLTRICIHSDLVREHSTTFHLIIILNSSIVISVSFLFEELFIKDLIFSRSSRESVYSFEASSSISSFIHSFLSSFLSSSSTFSHLELIMTTSYQMSNFIFAFCGTFSEAENISTSRWLMKFEHEMFEYRVNNLISSDKYLFSLNKLLIDETVEWFESHLDVIRLLNDSTLIQDTINAFKFLFCDRFSSRVVEIVSVSIDVELVELKQKSDETLVSYYKRMTSLMQRVDARNRSISSSSHLSESILFSLKSAMLNIILRTFIRELFELEIRREAIRDMISSDRSLKIIYQLIEKTRRINIEIQKLYDEEVRQNELSFYRELTQQSLSQTKIEVMLTQYHSNRSRLKTSSWSIHNDHHSDYSTNRFQFAYRSQSIYRLSFSFVYAFDQSQSISKQSLSSMIISERSSLTSINRGNEVVRSSIFSLESFSFAFISQKSRLFQSTFKNLSNRFEFRNSWINDTKKWFFAQSRLCVRCDHIDHIFRKCTNDSLSSWEQSHLKKIVFDQSTQINHLSTYDFEFDQKSRSYDHLMKQDFIIMSRSTSNTKMFDVIQIFDSSSSVSSSIEFEIAELFVSDRLNTSQLLSKLLSSLEFVSHVVVNYEKSFDLNKRSFVKESRSVQNFSVSSSTSAFTIADDDRRRRKEQKRVIKRVKSQSIMSMFNETLEK